MVNRIRLRDLLHSGKIFITSMPWRRHVAKASPGAMHLALVAICLVALVSAPLFGLQSDRAGASPGSLADTPWPMFRYDPQHTGRSPYTGPEVPVEKWGFPTGESVSSSPDIGTDGTIYVGSVDGKLYAIGEVTLESLLDQIEGEVSYLRGLSPLGEISTEILTREELRQQLIEELEEDIEEIEITQEIFLLLDLIEEGQDLYQIILDVNTEQVAGYYDDEVGILYVVGDVEELGPLEELTFAHEYTHALQDQHFDLSSLPVDQEDNSDLSLAVLSLVEGDATLLQGVYYWEGFDVAEREAFDQEAADIEDEAFEAAPRVIQQNLIFPYEQGIEFVLAIFKDGGWQAVNQAYSDPPQSTEQIIHPEKYLERDEPQAVVIPDLGSTLGAGWEQLDSDVLGELNMRIYLETFITTSQAARAVEGWDGDRCVFLKDAEGRKLLVLRSVWDSKPDAEEFFNAYIEFVAEKSGGTWDLTRDASDRKWWQTEGLSLYLEREGSNVLIVMAPGEAIAGKVIAEFAEFKEEEGEQDGNGGGAGCSCPGSGGRLSGVDLLIGFCMTGLCWGTAYYLARGKSRGKRIRFH